MTKEISAKHENLSLTPDNKIAFRIFAEMLDADGFATPEVEFTIRTMSQEIRGRANKSTGIFKSEKIIIDPNTLNPEVTELTLDIAAKNSESEITTQLSVEIGGIITKLRERLRKIQQDLKEAAERQRKANQLLAAQLKEAAERQRVETDRQREADRLEAAKRREAAEKAETQRREAAEKAETQRREAAEKVETQQREAAEKAAEKAAAKQRKAEQKLADAVLSITRFTGTKAEWDEIKKPTNINRDDVRLSILGIFTQEGAQKDKNAVTAQAFSELKTANWYHELVEKVAICIPVLMLQHLDKCFGLQDDDLNKIIDILYKSHPIETITKLRSFSSVSRVNEILQKLISLEQAKRDTEAKKIGSINPKTCSSSEIDRLLALATTEPLSLPVCNEAIEKLDAIAQERPHVVFELLEKLASHPVANRLLAIAVDRSHDHVLRDMPKVTMLKSIQIRFQDRPAVRDILCAAFDSDPEKTLRFMKEILAGPTSGFRGDAMTPLNILIVAFMDSSIKASRYFDTWSPQDKKAFEDFFVNERPRKASKLPESDLKRRIYSRIESEHPVIYGWNNVKDIFK